MSNINTSSSKMTEYKCLCGGRTATLFSYKMGAPEKVWWIRYMYVCVRAQLHSPLNSLQPHGL